MNLVYSNTLYAHMSHIDIVNDFRYHYFEGEDVNIYEISNLIDKSLKYFYIISYK